MNEEEYKALKRQAEEAKAEADRAQGALDNLKKRLKEDFGVNDLKSARNLLKELEREKLSAEKQFNKALEDYKKKWNEQT